MGRGATVLCHWQNADKFGRATSDFVADDPLSDISTDVQSQLRQSHFDVSYRVEPFSGAAKRTAKRREREQLA